MLTSNKRLTAQTQRDHEAAHRRIEAWQPWHFATMRRLVSGHKMKELLPLMSEFARRNGFPKSDRLTRRSRDVTILWLCKFDLNGTIASSHSNPVAQQFDDCWCVDQLDYLNADPFDIEC
jgi:hypothetical protein